ncbi:MAG TPA: hypothetical protein VF644_10580 [Pyrinomonadaceae bacterium]|jgi:hypothetical protein
MILAILAIAYAVYSNASLSQNLTALDNASRDVSTTGKDISEAAKDLSQKIEAIPTKLESVETRIAETNVLVRQFSEKPNLPTPTPDERKAISEVADLFINRAGTGALLAINLCLFAYETRKPFDIRVLLSESSFFTVDYAAGILGTMDAAGLISTNINRTEVSVTDLNENLKELSHSVIKERIDSSFNEYFSKSLQENVYVELSKIEDYFK